MAGQPNILIFVADQMRAASLPPYGETQVVAPHIEALGAQGVVFDSAYCASPLCGPSRAAFLTGQLPSRIGAYDNACAFSSAVPTFAHHLRQAGYNTILSGKMHFVGPDQQHGFETRLTTDIYPADYGWTPDWTQPDARPDWYHSMTSVTTAGPCVRTNQIDFDEEVIHTTRRQLYDLARGADKRPFALVVSLTHPHDPFVIPQAYWDIYRDTEIDLPEPLPPEALDPHSQRLRHVCGIDLEPVTDAQRRDAIRAYYGAISYVDEQIGLVLKTLKETGQDEDTIVIVMSDHGEMLGERGLWFKMNFFEPSARVPFIVHAPQRFQPARVSSTVSLLDLAPTLLELAGAEPLARGDGRSLVPNLEGAGGHDEATGEYLAEGAVAPVIMLRRGRYKFIHSPADPDQLYDPEADPGERVNLAGAAEHNRTLDAFRSEAARRWDFDRLQAEVIASQSARRFIAEALRKGKRASWDYQPPRDAAQEYIRDHMALEDIEAVARFPRVHPSTSS